jgi:DNA-binding LacI/PurR family transcriptional regulator
MSQAELARLAFRALLSDVQREAPAPHGSEYLLETKLVLRKSTALAPGAIVLRPSKPA